MNVYGCVEYTDIIDKLHDHQDALMERAIMCMEVQYHPAWKARLEDLLIEIAIIGRIIDQFEPALDFDFDAIEPIAF